MEMEILGLFYKVTVGGWYGMEWSRLAQKWVSLWKGSLDECSLIKRLVIQGLPSDVVKLI